MENVEEGDGKGRGKGVVYLPQGQQRWGCVVRQVVDGATTDQAAEREAGVDEAEVGCGQGDAEASKAGGRRTVQGAQKQGTRRCRPAGPATRPVCRDCGASRTKQGHETCMVIWPAVKLSDGDVRQGGDKIWGDFELMRGNFLSLPGAATSASESVDGGLRLVDTSARLRSARDVTCRGSNTAWKRGQWSPYRLVKTPCRQVASIPTPSTGTPSRASKEKSAM